MKDKVEIRAGVTITREEYEQLHEAFNAPDPPKFKRWKPKYDEEYWYVQELGEVSRSVWDDHPFDLALFAMGNVYCTREEAQLAVDRQKAIVRMQDKANQVRTHPEPDRADVNVTKYYARWNCTIGKALQDFYQTSTCPPEVPVFATRKELAAFIEIAAPEIELYYTGKRPEGYDASS